MIDSRFRPRLDAPGGWDCWTLGPAELDRLARNERDAADAADNRLRALYGPAATIFGATRRASDLGAVGVDQAGAFAIARALAAFDYFAARAAPPIAEPGGMTNPVNRRRWEPLRDHMLERVAQALGDEAVNSILSQCVFTNIPQAWIPVPLLEQSFANGLAPSEAWQVVSVCLDVRLQPPGGLRRLDEESERGLRALRIMLDEGRVGLVELLRGTTTSPLAAELVIAYAIDLEDDDRLRIHVWDPATGVDRRIATDTGPDGRRCFIEPETGDAGSGSEAPPTVKAVRLWEVSAVQPPLPGLRRFLPWQPPWRVYWWIRRWIALRKAENRIPRET